MDMDGYVPRQVHSQMSKQMHSTAETLAFYRRVYGLSEADMLTGDGVSEEEVVAGAYADYHLDRTAAFHIDPAKCALLVIDMQVGFVRRSSPQWIPQAERIVPALDAFATALRQQQIPVFFTSAMYLDPSPNDGLRMTTAIADGNLGEGSAGLEVLPELVRDGDVIIANKHTYDPFWQTDLDYRLRALQRDTIIVTGTLTNFCCEAAARAGHDRGYHVVMCADLCASDNPWSHDATMQTMRRGVGRVLRADEVLAELG